MVNLTRAIYEGYLGNSVSWVKSLMICTMDKLHRNKSEYWNGNIKWLSSGELNRWNSI